MRGRCLAGAVLTAALVGPVVWLRSAGVLDVGCETSRHEICGLWFRCARCVHALQNFYWLARARLHPRLGCGVLALVLATAALCASSRAPHGKRGGLPASAGPGQQRASGGSAVRHWATRAVALAVLLVVCNQPALRPGQGHIRPRSSQLVVFGENWHGDEWGRWRQLLALAGIRLTDNPAERDHAHVVIDSNNCILDRQTCCSAHPGTPTVWAWSMYNGLPQQDAMHGVFDDFFPHVFSDCKYWFTKDESEAAVFRRAGLQVLAVPYFYSDITPSAREWDRAAQVEINGFFNGMGSRSPQDFVDAFRIKSEVSHVHFHGNDALDPQASAPAEFAKSKFTLHLKRQAHGPPYWCNSVARSVAAGVPVVMDRESWRRGLFGPLVVHNVSGVVLDSVQEIIAYLKHVPDDEYIRLRNSTLRYGRFLREPPSPEKVQETRNFFWKVYSDTSWVFEGKPLRTWNL